MTIQDITGRINLESFVKFSVILVAVTAAFLANKSDGETNSKTISLVIAEADTRSARTAGDMTALGIRMRGLEVREASGVERQSSLKRDVARIESDVKDLKRGQQQIMLLLQGSLKRGADE